MATLPLLLISDVPDLVANDGTALDGARVIWGGLRHLDRVDFRRGLARL